MRTERMRDLLRRLRAIADGPRSRARALEQAEQLISRAVVSDRAGLREHFADAMRRAREPELRFDVNERALELLETRGLSIPDALLEAEREQLDDELEAEREDDDAA